VALFNSPKTEEELVMSILSKASRSLLSFIGNTMKKYERLFQALVMAFMLLSIAAPAWADITFLSDTTTLVQAIATWLLVIIPVAAGAMLAYYALMKMFNEGDPQVAMKANHAMKNVIIAAVIGEAASGIIAGITSYYANQQTTSMLITHLSYFV
jgi:hypothetical protein